MSGTGPVSQVDVDRVGLSDEERAALDEGDVVAHDPTRPSKAEVEALEAEFKKKDGDGDDDDTDADADAEKKAAEAAAAAKKAEEDAAAAAEAKRKEDEAAAAAAANKPDAATTADADEPFTAGYVAPAVEDYDKKVTAIDERVRAAEVEFKAGTKNFDEFRAVEREAAEERRKLDEARLKHEISTESSEQRAAQRWQFEVDRFFAETARTEGVDYKAKKGLWAALDHEVKELAKDEANADKPGTWYLTEAHRRVKDQFGIVGKAAPAGDDAAAKAEAERKKKADAEAAAVAARKGAKPGAQQTLHGLPNADTTDTSSKDDEFAHLDGLSGMDLERALARMPEDAVDRYLKAA